LLILGYDLKIIGTYLNFNQQMKSKIKLIYFLILVIIIYIVFSILYLQSNKFDFKKNTFGNTSFLE